MAKDDGAESVAAPLSTTRDTSTMAITVGELLAWLGEKLGDDAARYRVLLSISGAASAVTRCGRVGDTVMIYSAERAPGDANALRASQLIRRLDSLGAPDAAVVCLGCAGTPAMGWTASRPSKRVLITA